MLFVLNKVLQALLLPPGLLLSLGLVALLLAVRTRRSAALALSGAGCALVAILSLSPVSDLLVGPLEARYRPLPVGSAAVDAAAGADAIVLLGGGTNARSPDAAGRDVLGQSTTRRAVHAARLQRQLGLPLIASGGLPSAGGAQESEAAVAVRFLVELGVPAGSLEAEEDSRTTAENAERVVARYQPSRVVLVTSAFHMARAAACFERLGVQVVPAPTDYLGAPGRSALEWLPSAESLRTSCIALREYVGIAVYRLFYGARPGRARN